MATNFRFICAATLDLTTPPAKSLRPRRKSAPASFTPRTRTARTSPPTSTRMFTATPTRDLPTGSPPKARNSLWPGLPMRLVSHPRVTTCPSPPSTNTSFQLLPSTNTNSQLPPNRPGNSPELVTRSFKEKINWYTTVSESRRTNTSSVS